MKKLNVNFFDHDNTVSFEYELSQTVNPLPIRTVGEVSILPSEGDQTVPDAAGAASGAYSSNPAISTCSVDAVESSNRSRISPSNPIQKSLTANQAILDEVDYESSEIVIHTSGKDLNINLDSPVQIRDSVSKAYVNLKVGDRNVIKRSSDGGYVTRDGDDPSTDQIIDPSAAGIVSRSSVITNILPVTDVELLMDAELWYRNKIGQVEYTRESQFFAFSDTDTVIRDDRRYAAKVTRKVKKRWWEVLLSGSLSSRENIYALDYDDYRAILERLENKLLPLGIAIEVTEYRNDYLPDIQQISGQTVSESVKTALDSFISSRSEKFLSNIENFGISPTDMSVRELIRRLFEPEDDYDRRDIKSRDIYTDAVTNAIDGLETNVNVGDDFGVLEESVYNDKYANLYNQLAYFAFPVKMGVQDIDARVCEDGVEVTKKIKADIGTKVVTVAFIDTNKLTAFSKRDVEDVPSQYSQTVSEENKLSTLVQFKIPGFPEDDFLRKMGMDAYGKIYKENADIIFPSDSDKLERLNPLVRNKFDFLLRVIKYEFGQDRVKLVNTTKSVEKVKNELSDQSTFLSWHNHGYACRIVILDSENRPIKDGSGEYMKLLKLAKSFANGCKNGLFGDPATVVWGSQLNVNPDMFEWEIFPQGLGHLDVKRYRDNILSLKDPLSGEDLNPKNIEEFIFLMHTKFDAYGSTVPDVQADLRINYPLGNLSGEIPYINNSGEKEILSIGTYVQLENQADESLNAIWEVMPGKWREADKYIKWAKKNPISLNQLKLYYSLIGDYAALRTILSIEYINFFGNVDDTLDAENYLSSILRSSDGTRNFFNGISDNGEENLDDAIKATNPLSPASFFMVDDKKIKTPLFEVKLSRREPVSYECKLVNGSFKIVSNAGTFIGVEKGDLVSGFGIPAGAVVENVYGIDIIKLSNSVETEGLSNLTFSAPRLSFNKNLHGQQEIHPMNISKYLTGEYDSTENEYLSDSDRQSILEQVKQQVIDNIESIRESYQESGVKFMFDSFENGPNADDEQFLENEFGVISIQEVLDLDVIENIYTADPDAIASEEQIYNPDTEQRDETLLNIFEETVSVSRGVRIATTGAEKPKIEPLEDDRELKRQLQSRYSGGNNSIDVSDF